MGIFRVRVVARPELAVRARTQSAATVRLGLGATAAPRLVSTPEMDAQMRVGHWGPVTATLDWCEVRHLQLRVYYTSDPSRSPFSKGQLSVFSLRGRNIQLVLQPFLHLHIYIRRTSIIEGIFTRSVSSRICCSSFFFAPQPLQSLYCFC